MLLSNEAESTVVVLYFIKMIYIQGINGERLLFHLDFDREAGLHPVVYFQFQYPAILE